VAQIANLLFRRLAAGGRNSNQAGKKIFTSHAISLFHRASFPSAIERLKKYYSRETRTPPKKKNQ
jgi:hypothetical protein